MTASVLAPKTGKNMKAYRNTATYASPTWVELCEIGDLRIADLSMGMAELKRRCNGFTKNLPSIIQSIAVEFRLISGLGATVYTAIRTAFFAGTCEEYAFMDDTITYTGAQGLRCPCVIEQFPSDQPLEDICGHDVRLLSGYLVSGSAEVDPIWYTVS